MIGLFRVLIPYLRRHWAQTLLLPIVQVPSIAFITLQPLLLRLLIDNAIPRGDRQLAILIIIGMLSLVCINAAGELAYYFVVARLSAFIMNDIRLQIFSHLQWLSVRFYVRASGGDLLSRFTSDSDTVNRVLTDEAAGLFF
jgi:ATP-binding cassette subfamily B protein